MIDELKRSNYYLFDFIKMKLSNKENESGTNKIQYKNNEEVQTAE